MKRMQSARKLLILVLILSFIFIHNCSIQAADVLTLNDALKLGLKNNNDVVQSEIDREIARDDYTVAKEKLLPSVSLNSSYTKTQDPSFPVSKIEYTDRQYSTQLSVTQPVYAGGKLKLGVRQAEKQLELSDIQGSLQKNETLNKIISAYYNVLMAADRVDIEQEALDLVQEHQRLAKVSYEVGNAIKTDLLQAEIEATRAQQSLESAKNQYWLAKRNLGNMIGFEQDFIPQEPEIIPSVELDLTQLHKEAVANRDEVKQLNLSQEMTETNLLLQKKSHYPDIYLTGNYSWSGENFTLNDGSWSITLSGNLSIFDGGQTKTKISKIKKQLQKIEKNKENLSKGINLQIEQQLTQIKEQKNNLEIENMNIQKAQENLDLEEKRFQAGVGRTVDVLNAQTTLKQAKIAHGQAEYKLEKSKFDLLYSTGQLADYIEGVISDEK